MSKEQLQDQLTPDEKLADDLAQFYADPLGHVMYSYPWDSEPSIQKVRLSPKYRKRFPNSEWGPDEWACKFLDEIGKEVRKRGFNGVDPVEPIQFTTASGHGIGKSTLVAWIIKWIMDTRPHAKGIVTATTVDQLRTKTWAELAKWHHMSLTEHWFELTTGRGALSLYYKLDETKKQRWRCDAQTAREENSESFAGLHAADSTPFYIFDEASGVPDKIFEVREGGKTDGEPMIFDFGNPTRKSGAFFENTEGRFKHRYIIRKIDSRDVAITNKKQIAQWIEDYGEDSDFVRVRVRGEFPVAGSLQFMPSDIVHDAGTRVTDVDRYAPVIIGVDVAREGDDESVVYPRVGQDARSFMSNKLRYRGLDGVQLAGKVIELVRYFEGLGRNVNAICVDRGNSGATIIDVLRRAGWSSVHEINFGTKPMFDPKTYRYRGDEMWGRLREAIGNDLMIPSKGSDIGRDLEAQLTQREYGYTLAQKLHLETKRDMKSRGLPSPDIADALALTFAIDLASTVDALTVMQNGAQVLHDYDPLAAIS